MIKLNNSPSFISIKFKNKHNLCNDYLDPVPKAKKEDTSLLIVDGR